MLEMKDNKELLRTMVSVINQELSSQGYMFGSESPYLSGGDSCLFSVGDFPNWPAYEFYYDGTHLAIKLNDLYERDFKHSNLTVFEQRVKEKLGLERVCLLLKGIEVPSFFPKAKE